MEESESGQDKPEENEAGKDNEDKIKGEGKNESVRALDASAYKGNGTRRLAKKITEHNSKKCNWDKIDKIRSHDRAHPPRRLMMNKPKRTTAIVQPIAEIMRPPGGDGACGTKKAERYP
jgi:putative protein kinase ArgK-like GTPase of G3E family